MPNTTYTTYDNVTYLFGNTSKQYVKPKEPKQKITHDELKELNDFDRELKTRHDAEPFRTQEDIEKILSHFLTQHNKSWNTAQKQPSRKWNPRYLRNFLLLQIGCNAAVRCSDLVQLQIGDFIDKQGHYREVAEILEMKTINTRSVSKARIIDINDCIISAIELHKKYNSNWTREDYLFPRDYDADRNPSEETLTRRGVDHIIKNVTDELNIQGRYATHSMRKYFGRQFIMQNGNNERAVLLLQTIYGHSDLSTTKHYIGITRDEIRNACMNLHLGFTNEDLMQRGLV